MSTFFPFLGIITLSMYMHLPPPHPFCSIQRKITRDFLECDSSRYAGYIYIRLVGVLESCVAGDRVPTLCFDCTRVNCVAGRVSKFFFLFFCLFFGLSIGMKHAYIILTQVMLIEIGLLSNGLPTSQPASRLVS